MTYVFQKDSIRPFCKGIGWLISLIWSLGLAAGMILQFFAGDFFFPMMRGILSGSVSIVCLLASAFLPFLFSAFAVYISQPWLLLLIAFWNAFAYSFLSFSFIFCFGSSGWLLRLFLMFHDCLLVPMLFWYLHSHSFPASRFSYWEFFLICMVILGIGIFDYGYILPLLADMINS